MSDVSMSVPVDNKNFIGIGKMTFESHAECVLFVLRGLIPRLLGRLIGIKLRIQYLMRTTYPVPLGRGC